MTKNKLTKGVIVFALYLIIPMLIPYFLPNIGESNTVQLLIRAIIDILLLSTFIYIYREDLTVYFKKLKEEKKSKFVLRTLIYVLITIVIMLLSGYIVKDLIFPNLEITNDALISTYYEHSFWYMFLSTIIIAPVVEEIVFRKVFKDIISNKWFYLLFSTLVFCFYHAGYNWIGMESLVIMLNYLGAGFIFAYAYQKSDNIYLPIAVHMLYNIFVLIVQLG